MEALLVLDTLPQEITVMKWIPLHSESLLGLYAARTADSGNVGG